MRQLSRWRRTIPEFRDAYDLAREQRADARSDRVDEILLDLRAGKITAADARVLIEAELKLAAKENPARYGDVTRADVTVRPGAPNEKPDTGAWLDKVLGAGAVASNVVRLLPAPKDDAA